MQSQRDSLISIRNRSSQFWTFLLVFIGIKDSWIEKENEKNRVKRQYSHETFMAVNQRQPKLQSTGRDQNELEVLALVF